jgi:exosortase
VQIVTVTLLMVALFRFNLARLWGKTNPIDGQDPNWQHSIFVPLIGIYYLYIHREELLRAAGMPRVREQAIRILACLGLALMAVAGAAFLHIGEHGTPLWLVGVLAAGLAVPAIRPTSSAFGSVLMLEGLLVFAYGIFPGQNDYVKDLGMVITLFGVVTMLAGWPVMRIAWFPIVFLVVALPWPELVYSRLASPLQQLAASAAVGTLRMFGVNAHNFGTKIEMFDKAGMPRVLNVAEACAGLKSVMTFLMVGATVAFLSQRALWEKLVITASAVPIAIFCNVVRVCGQGLLDRYVSREWSEGFAHQFAGLVMVIPGFFLILAVGWLLDQLFIEEVEAPAAGNGAGNGGGAAAAGAAVAVNRSKRLVVEVPRKKLAGGPAAPNSNDETMVVATPGVPAAAPVATPAPAPVAKQATAPAAASAPASKPAPAAPPAVAPRQSTLKAPPTGTARPAASVGPAPVAGSTLKPSSKPVAPRAGATAPPPPVQRPSTLKPAAPKPPAAANPSPQQPVQPKQAQGIKPPAAAPRPAPQQQQQQQQRPPAAPPRQQQPRQQPGGEPKSE